MFNVDMQRHNVAKSTTYNPSGHIPLYKLFEFLPLILPPARHRLLNQDGWSARPAEGGGAG